MQALLLAVAFLLPADSLRHKSTVTQVDVQGNGAIGGLLQDALHRRGNIAEDHGRMEHHPPEQDGSVHVSRSETKSENFPSFLAPVISQFEVLSTNCAILFHSFVALASSHFQSMFAYVFKEIVIGHSDMKGNPPHTTMKAANGTGHKLQVHWLISDVEEGTRAQLWWDHGCDSLGKAEGQCTFKKEDKNPPGLHVVSGQGMEGCSFQAGVDVDILGAPYKMTTTCPVCGSVCNLEAPVGGAIPIAVPACPLPPNGLTMVLGAADFSVVPSFFSLHATVHLNVTRPNGGTVAAFQVDVDM